MRVKYDWKNDTKKTAAQVRETKVAIYIRVSTIHQIDKDSIPMQKRDLAAYCQLILGTDNYDFFEDAGYSYDSETQVFSILEEEAAVCIELKDLYIKNYSLICTARALNEKGYKTRAGVDWTPTSVWIIASSPFYAGIYRYNRYKGTENRTINPEDEWVMVKDHHPAIFTLEEHELMCNTLKNNSRNFENTSGRIHSANTIHVFQGIAYCGKCRNKMVSTPGRKHTDGYRSSNYSCPLHRKSHKCDNSTVNDIIIGEFVINYILNMLNAKKSFSCINTPDELQKKLLTGSTFSDIASIESNGLNEFFNLLSRYGSDNSYIFAVKKPQKKKAAINPEIAALKKEKEKLERAMQRLQDLYLYSDKALSEKDFIIRKSEITSHLKEINAKLGLMNNNSESLLSDEEFIRQASHLLIQKELEGKKYIYYKKLASTVDPDILKTYMDTILDSIFLIDGHISSIVFKNGLNHVFNYKE